MPSLALVRLQWSDVFEEVDDRSTFQTEDATQRAVVIRDRFAVFLLSLPSLRHWMSGGTSAQEYESAVSLAQELLDVSKHRPISAFRSLESFLSSYDSLQLVAGMTASVSASERCTALVARVRDERRNRPAGRDGNSNEPAPTALVMARLKVWERSLTTCPHVVMPLRSSRVPLMSLASWS